jgi:hypothetical protein
MNVLREIPNRFVPGAPNIKIYTTPVPLGDGFIATMRREPLWQVTGIEKTTFAPRFYPDNIARAMVFDGEGFVMNDQMGIPVGGPDIFGVEWVFIPAAGGSMVKPGKPILKDANDWEKIIKFPNVDSWDWAGSAKKNEMHLAGLDVVPQVWIMNGFFERLISFMDFESAAVAMVDEEQQKAVRELMDALAELYIDIVDHYKKYFGLINFLIHDDWGSQMAPFFSPVLGRELIVPAMRRLNDHIHSLGGTSEFHCCGHVDACVPNMIEAGWDTWMGMGMNDTQKDYELYGDKIVIAVIPDRFDPETTPEEKQREEARKYVDRFCKPGKPSVVNGYGYEWLTPAFREEVYRYSRIKLGGVH